MRGAPHNGFAWLMFRIKSRISAGTFGLPDAVVISASNTKRRLCGAKRQPYRGERCANYDANRATIARAKPTKAGRNAGGANEAGRSFEKPRVGDEARGSPPGGGHGFENWSPTERKGQRKESSSW